MDRHIVYPGQNPLDTDLLYPQKHAFIALAKLAAAILGTNTLANGLACNPTSPASLGILVGPGELYALENVDPNAYGSLAADTTHSILKQGIIMDAVQLTLTPPGTSGYSINYLIEAAFSEVDENPIVLPYYNASNPALAYSGPSGAGTAQNTLRQDTIAFVAKAGVAAATGSQTTPAPDSGYVPLWVVTVANGQTTITSANISQASGALFLTETLPVKISEATGDARYLQQVNARIKLTANLTLYVSPSGNDSNNGLTAGTPFATIQHAWNIATTMYDLAGWDIIIQLANGTYTAGLSATGVALGSTGPSGSVFINGNSGSPGSVIVNVSGGTCFFAETGAQFIVQNLTVEGGAGLAAIGAGSVIFYLNVIFGACSSGHISVSSNAYILCNGSYAISGSAPFHVLVQGGGTFYVNTAVTVTLTGTPAFSSGFIDAATLAQATVAGMSFSGSATGPRYAVASNAIINTNGAGASYLPGSTVGSTATGGLYL